MGKRKECIQCAEPVAANSTNWCATHEAERRVRITAQLQELRRAFAPEAPNGTD